MSRSASASNRKTVWYDDELKRFIDEAARSVAGKTVRIRQGNVTSELDAEQREVVLGMLTETAGVYDQGLRTEGGVVSRVLNAPGLSPNPEIESTRRLWIDVETFLPHHFDFSFFMVDLGNYSYDLVVDE